MTSQSQAKSCGIKRSCRLTRKPDVLRTVVIPVLLSTAFAGSLSAQMSLNQTELRNEPMPKSTAPRHRQTSSPKPLGLLSQSGNNIDPQNPGPAPASTHADRSASQGEGKQPKRILWVIPNYRAVSANVKLPPLSAKGKLWLGTQDSFDYSSFVLAGIVAGISQAGNDTPEFHRGVAAYGRYYWHTFTDEAVGNYFTEAFLPIAVREDPRYYTLGHDNGSFGRRTGYALTRLVITRTDSGGGTFNLSEVVGNGAGAAISDLYYPRQERTWSKTGQKWLLQIGIDGFFNIAKEFWPDINHHVFHDRYGSQ
jgi:hypothetical protein